MYNCYFILRKSFFIQFVDKSVVSFIIFLEREVNMKKDYKELKEKIEQLKKEKDILIIAHNYQRPEIQDVADFLGDSLELAKKAANLEKEKVLFCGVTFMGESTKIVAPEKTVLLPNKNAGCAMADMITAEDVRRLREEYPDYTFVAYVNTSAEVKAEVDVCCTSANALKIVENIDNDKIYFLPDKNLGEWVKRESKKDIKLWPGFCYVHNRITINDLSEGKKLHPDALAMVHPESPIDVLQKADAVLSTGQMIKFVNDSKKEEFLVGTEAGMIYRLSTIFPDKKFYEMGREFVCKGMKRITLEDVYNALLNEQYEITVDKDVRTRAKKALDRMLEF